MNIEPESINEVIAAELPDLAKLIHKAIAACGKHERTATLSLNFTARRDPDAPTVVQLMVQSKIKEPKSESADLNTRSEKQEAGRWKADEDEGQQKID